MLEFSPIIREEAIFNAIRQCTNFSLKKIQTIFSLFIFSGAGNEDFWLRPIIPYSKDEYLFIFSSTMVPNLIRSIESWMKIGGIELSTRGKLYEKFLIKQISHNKGISRYLKNATEKSIRVELNHSFEQIDCLFSFGCTIIVFDIKCSFFPTSGLERHNYFDLLREAIVQVNRKASFLKDNLDEFLSKYGWVGLEKKEKIQILPCVISNQYLGSGYIFEGVPVIDPLILFNFIKGEQSFFAESSGTGFSSPGKIIALYDSVSKAENIAFKYLCNPPTVSILKKMLDVEHIKIPMIRKNNKPVLTSRIMVNQPPEFKN